MQIDHAYYLIIDLEATCNSDGSIPRDEMEIIEIGALMQDTETFEVVSEFQTFVRPGAESRADGVLHGIDDDHTSRGWTRRLCCRTPLQSLKKWMQGFDDTVFCSWGKYDRGQFEKDCRYHNLDYPFPPQHINLKEEFSRALNTGRRFGLDGALKRLGLEFEGTHHRGIDDVRNMARIVRRVCCGE